MKGTQLKQHLFDNVATPQQICAALLESGNVMVLDTETTGLSVNDEIVELAVLDQWGRAHIDNLVNPCQLIPPEAAAIHKITTGLARAQGKKWSQCAKSLDELSDYFFIMFNSPFDLLMIEQTNVIHKTPTNTDLAGNTIDLMELANRHFIKSAEWCQQRSQFKRLSLKACCLLAGIDYPENAHQALIDCQLTLELMQFIASDTGR